jgi:hypothetical protein
MYIIPNPELISDDVLESQIHFYLSSGNRVVMAIEGYLLALALGVKKYTEVGAAIKHKDYQYIVYEVITNKGCPQNGKRGPDLTEHERILVKRYFLSLNQEQWEELSFQSIIEYGPITDRWWVKSKYDK